MIDKDSLEWVLSAVSRDESRVEITRAWINDGWLFGTDGHRLHMVRTTETDGWIDENGDHVVELPGFEITPFDVMTEIVPDVREWKPLVVSNVAYEWPDKTRTYEVEGRSLNAKYFDDAVCGLPDAMVGVECYTLIGGIKTRADRPLDILLMKSLDGNRQALIMPVRPFDSEEWEEKQKLRERRTMNTIDREKVICPYCGCDDFESDLGGGECEEAECGECGEIFMCECEVEIRYSTRKTKDGKKNENQ